jgi:hypothetical protein
MPYKLYATNRNGDGYVQHIGTFDEVEDVIINVGHFAPDVRITIEVVCIHPELPEDFGKVSLANS